MRWIRVAICERLMGWIASIVCGSYWWHFISLGLKSLSFVGYFSHFFSQLMKNNDQQQKITVSYLIRALIDANFYFYAMHPVSSNLHSDCARLLWLFMSFSTVSVVNEQQTTAYCFNKTAQNFSRRLFDDVWFFFIAFVRLPCTKILIDDVVDC